VRYRPTYRSNPYRGRPYSIYKLNRYRLPRRRGGGGSSSYAGYSGKSPYPDYITERREVRPERGSSLPYKGNLPEVREADHKLENHLVDLSRLDVEQLFQILKEHPDKRIREKLLEKLEKESEEQEKAIEAELKERESKPEESEDKLLSKEEFAEKYPLEQNTELLSEDTKQVIMEKAYHNYLESEVWGRLVEIGKLAGETDYRETEARGEASILNKIDIEPLVQEIEQGYGKIEPSEAEVLEAPFDADEISEPLVEASPIGEVDAEDISSLEAELLGEGPELQEPLTEPLEPEEEVDEPF